MDFTGRRQSDNVDDRRKNWRIYEAFRPLHPQPVVDSENRHTDAIDRWAGELGKNPFDDEPSGKFLPPPGPLADPVPKHHVESIIRNLLRK